MNVGVLVRRHEEIERRARNEEEILAACKSWLTDLPDDAQFEFVEVKTKVGDTLAQCRQKIADNKAEVQSLRAIPTPSADIRERIKDYVMDLAASAQPTITGIGENRTLQITWPAMADIPGVARTSAPKRQQADALSLIAMLVAGIFWGRAPVAL